MPFASGLAARLLMHLETAPLDSLRGSALSSLLSVERLDYLRTYRWSFDYSAKLVNDLVATRGLLGVALLAAGEPVGYTYFVVDRHKAVIGDAYVRAPFDTPGNERLLLAATLEAIRRLPAVRRVEAQPMMLRYPYSHPRAQRIERHYLELHLPETNWPTELTLPPGYRLETWSWRHEAAAARILFDAYSGHIDAQINDQYLAPGTAKDYLHNLLSYPGCGQFLADASFFVLNEATGTPCAFLSASEIQKGVGHVTQLCVERPARGLGLGKAMLYASLAWFADKKWDWATLTVTAENLPAARLYTQAGFAERTRLFAYVWPQWPS
ncbi:MAG: GNAT family N-acetyltransferase [Bryobacter sp.]|nr:GNAT family N-acetyltransferase [Bryobacter sp.]